MKQRTQRRIYDWLIAVKFIFKCECKGEIGEKQMQVFSLSLRLTKLQRRMALTLTLFCTAKGKSDSFPGRVFGEFISFFSLDLP